MRRHAAITLTLLGFLAGAPSAARASQIRPGVGFIALTDGTPGTEVVLIDRRRTEVGRIVVDRFGSVMFHDLGEGKTYFLREGSGAETAVTTLDFRDTPPSSLYDEQHLTEGLQYIETRDGTLLSAMVRAPLGRNLSQGPFPTVVEYSGYETADPDSPQPLTLISSALGFATVAVNMRGSGCSGGVFDLFDLPTTADGYDIIETVARQPWVKGGKVGMVGISFSGISQLFVGGARPPRLAALTPLSVIADVYRAPGFPGGIFNNGFARSWLQDRVNDGRPAPEGGQAWAIRRVNQGDAVCRANQKIRLQAQDVFEIVQTHPFWDPALIVNRSPINWVEDIEAPTFFSSAWQDEQTGGDFASMLGRIPVRRDVKINLVNGVHSSTLDPAILWNWIAFLDIYVANQLPDPGRAASLSPIIYQQVLGNGTPTPPLPGDRFDGFTDLARARSLFESDPHVRVLMENGAGSPTAGLPAVTYELHYDRWPPPDTDATTWYFGDDGRLERSRVRSKGGVDSYRPDPSARPMQTLPGSGDADSWKIIPPYNWQPLLGETALGYATPPLTEPVTIVGPSSVDLWLRSSAPDTDLQVTLSEIRPDGKETYVQNGWLRASHRKLDRKASSRLEPRQTHLEKQVRPLPSDEFVKVRVGLYSVAHVFRVGSRIRLTIEAPGGDRTRWRFDTPATGGQVVNEVAHMRAAASRLVLPVVTSGGQPATLPACPGLRGQPCRTYVPASNGG